MGEVCGRLEQSHRVSIVTSIMKKLKLFVGGSLAFFLGTSIISAQHTLLTTSEEQAALVPKMAVDVAPFVCFGVSAACFAVSHFSKDDRI
jgi:hypothetical protein